MHHVFNILYKNHGQTFLADKIHIVTIIFSVLVFNSSSFKQ